MKETIRQWVLVSSFLFFTFLVFPGAVLASSYGECGYGEGVFGDGCVVTPTPTTSSTGSNGPSVSNNSSSTPTAPVCNEQSPGEKAPWLYAAVPENGNAITLYYGEAADPVDHYVLEFGTKSGEYPYGSTNIGDKGARTYLVQSLLPNTTYFFRVRAGNGCATGPWSNEIPATTKGLVSFNQLSFIASELEPIVTISESSDEELPPVCQTYAVKSGDSLWNIAINELGDGSKYTEIIEQNKDTYPSLSSSNSVSVGWELELNCEQSEFTTSGNEQHKDEQSTNDGYVLNVSVFDKNQKAVEGARVTIHSKVQEAMTDSDGKVRFENVEAGAHRVLIAYDDYQGEQSINLMGDTKEVNLNVTLEQKNILTSPLVMSIIGGMSLIILILLFLLWRAKSSMIFLLPRFQTKVNSIGKGLRHS